MLLHSSQFWILLIGALVPLPVYLLNKYAPWASEQFKSIVHVVLAAAAGVIYVAASNGPSVDFDAHTFEAMLTAVVGALGAHAWLWKPGGISTQLGGGQNA